jgi:hypothetical protein
MNQPNLTDEQIIDLFDTHPNLFLSEIATLTGKTVPELKKILLGSNKWN